MHVKAVSGSVLSESPKFSSMVAGVSNEALRCFKRLMQKNIKIITAESCTGGLLSYVFASIAGASAVLEGAFVTYSNDAKRHMLQVKQEVLDKYGAVSSEVAVAMAQGALRNSNAQLSLAITGIAGPSGGSGLKPVGLVYISCLRSHDEQEYRRHYFPNLGRNHIQLAAVSAALDFIFSRIK